jgi:hypothetical protein
MHRRWRKKREMKKKGRTGTHRVQELQLAQDEDEDEDILA